MCAYQWVTVYLRLLVSICVILDDKPPPPRSAQVNGYLWDTVPSMCSDTYCTKLYPCSRLFKHRWNLLYAPHCIQTYCNALSTTYRTYTVELISFATAAYTYENRTNQESKIQTTVMYKITLHRWFTQGGSANAAEFYHWFILQGVNTLGRAKTRSNANVVQIV